MFQILFSSDLIGKLENLLLLLLYKCAEIKFLRHFEIAKSTTSRKMEETAKEGVNLDL
jgi:hypothetical protein